jgi:hypothetical protein
MSLPSTRLLLLLLLLTLLVLLLSLQACWLHHTQGAAA